MNFCDDDFTAAYDQATLNQFDPVIINVYFWELRQDNGGFDPNDPNASDYPQGFEKEALDVIAALNMKLNEYRLFFKYKGVSEIHDTGLYDETSFTDFNGLLTANQTNDNAINFYVSPSINGGVASIMKNNILISRGSFRWNSSISIHEVGHCLGLLHTFQYYTGHLYGEDCEAITRLDTDDEFNADEAGDRVVDTNAIPNFRREHYWELYFEAIDDGLTHEQAVIYAEGYTPYQYLNENCEYTKIKSKNCHDDLYIFDEDDIANIMSYSRTTCTSLITLGQAIRMHEAIAIDCKEKLQNTIAPPEDGFMTLYEPYKGEYFYAGPFIPEQHTPLFQPGFTYEFVQCSGTYPEPADYNETFSYTSQIVKTVAATETDYSTIFHPNHSAIKIAEIDNLGNAQPQMCYNNWNRAPVGGKITQFNDGVFNTNVTITPQDSLQINDPNLIQNLENGLYKIDKNYEDGAIDEVVILKDN